MVGSIDTITEKNLLDCQDCKRNTSAIGEFYMVHHKLWRSIVKPGEDSYRLVLCIGCLEKRLKRYLVAADFLDCPLNNTRFSKKSGRLRERMGIYRKIV